MRIEISKKHARMLELIKFFRYIGTYTNHKSFVEELIEKEFKEVEPKIPKDIRLE